MFNMMIFRRDLLDDYCGWLFPILFELKDRIGTEGLSPFEVRYPGRVSEILFNVWLDKKVSDGTLGREEIKELPWRYMERVNMGKKAVAFLKAKFFGMKYEESF